MSLWSSFLKFSSNILTITGITQLADKTVKQLHDLTIDENDQAISSFDVCANLDSGCVIKPGQRVIVPTKLQLQIPNGFEVRILWSSRLQQACDILCMNVPMIIYPNYDQPIDLVFFNNGLDDFLIPDGMRIARGYLHRISEIPIEAGQVEFKWMDDNRTGGYVYHVPAVKEK